MVNSKQAFVNEGIGSARSATVHDAQVGLQIKRRRAVLGLTQWQLADQIGISFQQLHKYEAGANRIPALRLNQIAQALGAPLDYFFESATDPKRDRELESPANLAGPIEELVELFRKLPTSDSQARFLKLARFYVRELGQKD